MKIYSVLSQIAVNLFGVVKGVAALKLMTSQGAEAYAILSQYLIISTLIVQFVIFNYDVPFVSSLANNQGVEKSYNAILILIISNYLILLLIALFVSPGIADLIWTKSSYSGYIKWLLLYSIILTFNHLSFVISNGRKKFQITSLLQIMQQIFQLISLAIGVFNQSIYLVLMSLIIGEVLILMVGFKLVPRPSFEIIEFKLKSNWLVQNFHVALPLLVGSMMIWVIINGGRFAVVHISYLDELTKYAATFSIAILSGLFINPICSVFLPYFSMGEENREISAARAIMAGSIALIILTCSASIFLLSFSELVLNYLSDLKIYAGDEFVLIVCMSQLIYGQVRLLTLYLAVNGNSSISRRSLVVGAIVFLCVVYPLTSRWLSTGAATAILLAMVVSLLTLKKWISHIESVAHEFIHRSLIIKIWFFSFAALLIIAISKKAKYNISNVENISFTIGVVAIYIATLVFISDIKIKNYKKILTKVW